MLVFKTYEAVVCCCSGLSYLLKLSAFPVPPPVFPVWACVGVDSGANVGVDSGVGSGVGVGVGFGVGVGVGSGEGVGSGALEGSGAVEKTVGGMEPGRSAVRASGGSCAGAVMAVAKNTTTSNAALPFPRIPCADKKS